jgi:hypothetical protein
VPKRFRGFEAATKQIELALFLEGRRDLRA